MSEKCGKSLLRTPEAYFPPGYEYRWERNGAVSLLGIGAAFSLLFFRSLHRAAGRCISIRMGDGW